MASLSFGTPTNNRGISLDQFAGEDKSLLWPAAAVLPVKKPAKPVDLKGDELHKLPIETHAKCRVFKLWDAADHADYQAVLNKYASGLCVIRFTERHWNDEQMNMCVYVEWADMNLVIPEGRQQ